VGRVPRGFSLSPDGKRLFVTNSWDDTLSVIDTNTLAVTATWPVGCGAFERGGGSRRQAAVCGQPDQQRRGGAGCGDGRGREAAAGGARGELPGDVAGWKKIYATHVYPNPSPYRTAPESEITVIDAARAVVVDRMPLHAIAGVFHAAFSADGRLGVVAEYHPRIL
jgi:YVTN family beta-propeller protein